MRQQMLTLAADLEIKIARLKERIVAKEQKISDEDLAKLRDIHDELQDVVSG